MLANRQRGQPEKGRHGGQQDLAGVEVAVAAPQSGVELVGRGRQVGAQLREDVVRVAEAGAPHVVVVAAVLNVLCCRHDHDNGVGGGGGRRPCLSVAQRRHHFPVK